MKENKNSLIEKNCKGSGCMNINCGNCIFCQKKQSIKCGHCSKCMHKITFFGHQKFNLVTFKSENKIYFTNTKQNTFLLTNLNDKTLQSNIVEKISEDLFQKNFLYKLNEDESELNFVYNFEMKKNLIPKIHIKFENISFYLMIEKNLYKDLIEDSVFFDKSICNKLLFIKLENKSSDIEYILNGVFTKSVNIYIAINPLCNLNSNKEMVSKIVSDGSSLIVLSLLSNLTTTMLISVFIFKDLLDLPIVLRKNTSLEVQKFISNFSSFDCLKEIEFIPDSESFNSYYKIYLFLTNENLSTQYDSNIKTNFVYNLTEQKKSLSKCKSKIVIIDALTFGFYLLMLFLKIIFYYIKLYRNKEHPEKLQKVLNFIYSSIDFMILLILFDNLIYFLNTISLINANLLGIKDFGILFIRGLLIVVSLEIIYLEDIRCRNENNTAENESYNRNINTDKILMFPNTIKNLIIVGLAYFFNTKPEIWILIVITIQTCYITHILYTYSTKNRQNWGIFTQEIFYQFYIFIMIDFIFENDSFEANYFISLYIMGNTMAIFFIFFDYLNSKMQAYRKKIKQYNFHQNSFDLEINKFHKFKKNFVFSKKLQYKVSMKQVMNLHKKLSGFKDSKKLSKRISKRNGRSPQRS